MLFKYFSNDFKISTFAVCVLKVRKSLRFLLGNLHEFDPSTQTVTYEDLLPQDKYMMHLIHEFGTQVRYFTFIHTTSVYANIIALPMLKKYTIVYFNLSI